MNLSEIKKGKSATVDYFDNDKDVIKRLKFMGIVKGCTVKIVNISPFNAAIAVKCGETVVALSVKEAKKIMVKNVK